MNVTKKPFLFPVWPGDVIAEWDELTCRDVFMFVVSASKPKGKRGYDYDSMQYCTVINENGLWEKYPVYDNDDAQTLARVASP